MPADPQTRTGRPLHRFDSLDVLPITSVRHRSDRLRAIAIELSARSPRRIGRQSSSWTSGRRTLVFQ
ncbi:hypothetical protein RHCRD62_90230 [Rhodococcus sp. RD6.2]|nr:hypothetical protein RHCRD62_90230 [Rhodococcus sp. RD6.2]